jgi:hypothetical protein
LKTKEKNMKKNLVAMFLKIPADLKKVLKDRAEYEGISLTGLVISCVRTGLAHRLNAASVEEARINELIQGAAKDE